MNIILDSGYSFGAGVFETIKVVNRKPLFLERHLRRLNNSLGFLEIDKTIEEGTVYSYIEEQEEDSYALKLMVSESNTVLTSREDHYRNTDRYRGQRINISNVLRNSTSRTVYHKTFNYYDNILEKRASKRDGYDEVIFLNERGLVAEGAASNIFFIKDNEIYTPKISAGILNGTMRDYIIETYGAVEKDIKSEEMKDFSSAFITNSLMGVRYVSEIDSIKYEESDKINMIIKDLEKLGF